MENLKFLIKEINSKANPEKAKLLQGFFKTGKGEYGEGDKFLGLVVPIQREIAKKYDLSLEQIQILLNSKIHEQRLIALFILIKKFKQSDENEKEKIFNFYLKNTKNINNWDLVDLSAPNIVGNYLLNKNKKEQEILYKLANSQSIWEKRISILATFWFIRENQFEDSIKLAEILLKNKHDLIHKAVGWMLREIGKRNKQLLINFLDKHVKEMPRTMLRYSIEKLPEKVRKSYLNM